MTTRDAATSFHWDFVRDIVVLVVIRSLNHSGLHPSNIIKPPSICAVRLPERDKLRARFSNGNPTMPLCGGVLPTDVMQNVQNCRGGLSSHDQRRPGA